MIPLLRGISSTCLHHSCSKIYCILYRLEGLMFSIFYSRSLNCVLIQLGSTYSPDSIFLQSWEVLLSSNGRYPHTMAKRITPQLQMSTYRPLYFLLEIIQGAAQQGDPQAVLSISPVLQVLLNPKSTIFSPFFQSISKFQGFRSRWTMLSQCRQATPLIIFLKKRQAQIQSSLVFLTMWSKSSPFSTYSMTRKRCLEVSMISQSWMILGWRISLRMCISLDTLSTSATSIIFYFTSILIATFQPVRVWVASLTLPKVPSPIVLPSRQQPIFFYFYFSSAISFYNVIWTNVNNSFLDASNVSICITDKMHRYHMVVMRW